MVSAERSASAWAPRAMSVTSPLKSGTVVLPKLFSRSKRLDAGIWMI